MIYTKLHEGRRLLGLNQEEMALLLGETRENYNKIERGRRTLSDVMLEKIANLKGWPFTLDQMRVWRFQTTFPNALESMDDTQFRIAHHGKVAAGPLGTYEGGEVVGSVRVPDREPFTLQCFALTVSGESMSPMIPDGALIICRPHYDAPSPKKLYVVQDGEGNATLKLVMIDVSGNRVTLKPVNPSYPLIELDEEREYKCFEVVAHFNEWEMEDIAV